MILCVCMAFVGRGTVEPLSPTRTLRRLVCTVSVSRLLSGPFQDLAAVFELKVNLGDRRFL